MVLKSNKKVWENFIDGASFNDKLIKEDILNSWKRCKEYGVDSYTFNPSFLMKPEEKKEYILKCLPEYNDVGFKEFYHIVENLNLNISIYDKKARLKYIVNYEEKFDQLYPKIGYFKSADEQDIGTNSTCLALIENKAFMVIGSEHYNYCFHSYSCAAAPFYDNNNQVAGTINASYVNSSINQDTINIIYSLARIYERLILKRKPHKADGKPIKIKRNNLANLVFDDIVGTSKAINEVKDVARKAAGVDASVLIYGESGSGKEVFASAIHNASRRRDMPFVAINCGAIPADLIESELFGYEPGAFTGAVKKGKKGLLEYASGGTLFLDEVESMPLSIQIKLLRALSSYTIMRIGGLEPISIDVRVISASKKDLKKVIKDNLFREDLFYRINVIQVNIPPLRQRTEDIRPIFDSYLKRFSAKNNMVFSQVSEGYYNYLESYHWPGNVRQLINITERALVFSENGMVNIASLPSEIKESYIKNKLKKDFNRVFNDPLPEGKTLLQIAEEVIIERVLEEEKYNYSKTAARLGMSRPTLYKKINQSDRLSSKRDLQKE